MVDEKKLARLLELKSQRDTIDAEITALMGGERQKRTWTRRKSEGAEQQGPAPSGQ